jgi:hypothetical protein
VWPMVEHRPKMITSSGAIQGYNRQLCRRRAGIGIHISSGTLAQNAATGLLINCSTQMLTASVDSCKASSRASENQRCALSIAPDYLFTQKCPGGQ